MTKKNCRRMWGEKCLWKIFLVTCKPSIFFHSSHHRLPGEVDISRTFILCHFTIDFVLCYDVPFFVCIVIYFMWLSLTPSIEGSPSLISFGYLQMMKIRLRRNWVRSNSNFSILNFLRFLLKVFNISTLPLFL